MYVSLTLYYLYIHFVILERLKCAGYPKHPSATSKTLEHDSLAAVGIYGSLQQHATTGTANGAS